MQSDTRKENLNGVAKQALAYIDLRISIIRGYLEEIGEQIGQLNYTLYELEKDKGRLEAILSPIVEN